MTLDLARYLDAIRRYMPARTAVTAADSTFADRGAELVLYVNDPPRAAVALGDSYLTFVVTIDRASAEPVRVTHFRSRKGANGDETLPP